MPTDGTLGPLTTETLLLDSVLAHPRNYREHPDDQIEHLKESLRAHGPYRNIVVSRDGYILAGHGIVKAARSLGFSYLPGVRLDMAHDDPRALKLLAGDNEIARLAAVDDRVLAELLKEISTMSPEGLVGTGWDDAMLANLVLVTRPESEIPSPAAAAEWAGMPEYDGGREGTEIKIVVSFETTADREAFMAKIGATVVLAKNRETWSLWWPEKQRAARPERMVETPVAEG